MAATLVAVLGDTHLPRGRRTIPEPALELCREADLVLHTGDFAAAEVLDLLDGLGTPWLGVHGNVDGPDVRARVPETLEHDVGQVRVGMVHDAGPAAGRLARLRRRFPSCDVVAFGHSHIPLHEHDALGGFHIVNPGSATDRRRQPRHTMALLRIAGQDVGVEHVALD